MLTAARAEPIDLLSALAEIKRDPAAVGTVPVGAFGLALRLAAPADVEDDALIGRLGAWRAQYMDHYPTQFTVTTEGTREWMRDRVVGDPHRVMFLLVDEDDPFGSAYGHLGFVAPDPHHRSLQLSNLLNGDRDRLSSGAMRAAVRRMLAWAGEVLGVTRVTVVIFEDNERSRRLHSGLGFVVVGRIGLRRVVERDTVVYRPLEEGDTATPDRWWVSCVWTAPGR
jgi:RimJ/RimL family protein N-acetyltransferase